MPLYKPSPYLSATGDLPPRRDSGVREESPPQGDLERAGSYSDDLRAPHVDATDLLATGGRFSTERVYTTSDGIVTLSTVEVIRTDDYTTTSLRSEDEDDDPGGHYAPDPEPSVEDTSTEYSASDDGAYTEAPSATPSEGTSEEQYTYDEPDVYIDNGEAEVVYDYSEPEPVWEEPEPVEQPYEPPPPPEESDPYEGSQYGDSGGYYNA